MITSQQILDFTALGEGKNVDFKLRVPSKVREITEEVCSFANSEGGYVLIGIDNKNQIVGTDIDNNTRSAIQGSIGEVSPTLHYEMYSVIVEGKAVWVIEVPAGRNKPYLFSGAIYVREGANCQKLTQVDDMRQFFQQNDRIYFDAIPMRGVDLLAQLHEDNYQEFRREAGISSEIAPRQVLENLQLFDDFDNVKRGGVMFFSAHPERYFFQAITRCVQFKGTDKVFIIDDKTFNGPLLQQYNQAIAWLQSKLSVRYVMEGAGPRREIWEIPISVFKEAILNALSHRDYYEQGATICIEMYDDRVEISNPGGLLPLVAKDFGHRSLTRNPLVFSLFTRMHLVEHIGSGIMRMQKDMLEAQLPAPQFSTEGFFTVTLSRQQKEDNSSSYNNTSATLTALQQQMLNLMRENPCITTTELMSATGMKKTAIYSNIRKLKDLRLLSLDPDGRWHTP